MADIEKVIKGLERCLKHTCPDIYSKEYKECEYTVGLYCGKDKLLHEALELLKEQPKWIPINERKPNSCGVYIVARWFIDSCRRKILTDACYFDGSNTWHDDTRVNHSRPYLTDKIVAWMPLPNPPKDGEQE